MSPKNLTQVIDGKMPMGYNGWRKRTCQLAAVVGGRVGKLHEMFRLMDDTYRIYIREPTHDPPRLHLYRTGNNGMRAILEIETPSCNSPGSFQGLGNKIYSKRKAHLLRVCAEILRTTIGKQLLRGYHENEEITA